MPNQSRPTRSVELLRAESRLTEQGLRQAHRLGLSTVQAEMLALLTDGFTLSEVAERLGVTEGVVRYRFPTACQVLGLRSVEGEGREGKLRTVMVARLFAAGVLPYFRMLELSQSRARLTQRQMHVLLGSASGLSNDEIARRLRITVFTAKMHLRQTMMVLRAVDRAHVVRRGFELGLLKVSDTERPPRLAMPPLMNLGELRTLWARREFGEEWLMSVKLR